MIARGDFSNFFSNTSLTSRVDFTVQAPPLPTLGFSPNSLPLVSGANANVAVTVPAAPGAAQTVTLTASPAAGAITAPATATVPAGATSSPTFTVTGGAAGSASLTASAAGFNNGLLNVAVSPGLSLLTPSSAPPGTPITFTGTGFVAGATTHFGTTSSAAGSITPTSLIAAIPAGFAAGVVNVTVTVAGQTSAPMTLTVTPPVVVPPAATLFRTSAQDVQTFTFTAMPASFTLVDTDAATAQGGQYAVGVAQTPTTLARSSPADVQAFTIAGTPANLTLSATRSGALSGTGSAVAISGTTIVRAIDTGIQVGVLGAGTITPLVNASGSVSATGVAVDILGTMVVRAHSGGIDLFSVSNPAAPVRLSAPGTGGGDASAVGTGVRFVSATRVVRSTPQGIELYDITNPAAPVQLAANRTGFVDAAMGTAVAVEPGGAAVIRATSRGVERYTLAAMTITGLVGSSNGRVSTTGVGVVVVGPRVFRATNDHLEVYNLPALGPVVTEIAATVSAIGVGLTGR